LKNFRVSQRVLESRSERCAEILESVHSDYRALEKGELIRDATDPSSNSLTSRQVLKEDSGKKTNITAHPVNRFPHNVGGLLPRTY